MLPEVVELPLNPEQSVELTETDNIKPYDEEIDEQQLTAGNLDNTCENKFTNYILTSAVVGFIHLF